jgi:hypothetical protein
VFKVGGYIIFLGTTTQNNENTIGIVINASSENSFYPEQSISIININKQGAVPKT